MKKEWNENEDELTPVVIGKLLEEDNLSEEELNAVLKSVKIGERTNESDDALGRPVFAHNRIEKLLRESIHQWFALSPR